MSKRASVPLQPAAAPPNSQCDDSVPGGPEAYVPEQFGEALMHFVGELLKEDGRGRNHEPLLLAQAIPGSRGPLPAPPNQGVKARGITATNRVICRSGPRGSAASTSERSRPRHTSSSQFPEATPCRRSVNPTVGIAPGSTA